MEINERIKDIELLETYGSLLTKVQKSILDDYYLYDLSLSEIAEQKGISRAAISDTINKAIKKMNEYENVLHIIKDKKDKNKIIEELKEKYPQIKDEIDILKK